MLSTLQIILISILLGILIGWTVLLSARYLRHIAKARQFSFRSLFHDFERKMWVTLGLGFIFTLLYTSSVMLGRYLIDSEARLNVFALLHQNPVEFIWWGLAAFAFLSVCIHVARLIIIHLYNSIRKGS